MKVFISWSGEISNKVALAFREWLPSVIQAIEPYVSSEDIDKGARWSTDIAKELEASRFGILCVTRENADAPWLNFEAGALSKTIDKSRVSPFLFGLKRSEIRTGPLLQFQSTVYEKSDVAKLLHSINCAAEPRCIDETRLDSVFDVWWPKLQEFIEPHLAGVEASGSVAVAPSSGEMRNDAADILEEILELTRSQHKLLNSPESILPPPYLEHIVRRLPLGDSLHFAPAALEDLYSRWMALRDLAKGSSGGDNVPPEVVFELVEQLEGPIEYLCRRTRGRRTLGRRPPGEP